MKSHKTAQKKKKNTYVDSIFRFCLLYPDEIKLHALWYITFLVFFFFGFLSFDSLKVVTFVFVYCLVAS